MIKTLNAYLNAHYIHTIYTLLYLYYLHIYIWNQSLFNIKNSNYYIVLFTLQKTAIEISR